MPQHCEEEPQLAPWPAQLVPLVQTPLTQERPEQHVPEPEQEEPWPVQPLVPEHTPPEQVSVPQQ